MTPAPQARSILITGAARGIGRQLLDSFAAEGFKVAFVDRQEAFSQPLVSGTVPCWPCDVSDPAAVDQALFAIRDSGFMPDVLINNAGIIHSEPLVNMLSRGDRAHDRDNWRKVIAADLDSVFFMTSRMLDIWTSARHKGVVISISSVCARGNPGQSAYSAAKAGVNALTRTWARELGPMGYRFAAIAPGFLDTPSTRAALSESTLSKLQQQIPLRRLGDASHIFLAARHIIENDYINGTVLEVDGGYVL